MPSHSHSSHSSHSHSSHSSHSHSSHSSHSYSYHSHSGSSHSSYYGSSPRFSKPSSEFTRNRSVVGTVIPRARVNQPLGFSAIHKTLAFTNHYAENHNYAYYPADWEYDGVFYKRGYYDENGNYYDRVAFSRDGNYYNVLCECPYCGSKVNRNWLVGEDLKCQNCGGNMEVKTQIDTYTQDPEYTYYNETAPLIESRARNGSSSSVMVKIFTAIIICMFAAPFIVVPAMVILTSIFGSVHVGTDGAYVGSSGSSHVQEVSNIDIYGTTIYLDYVGDNTYKITNDSSGYDKKLTWDYKEDSYYDKDSRCYVWYNTDVSPNLWQYYYMGISDDFPDGCGWFEYEPSGWYIQRSEYDWDLYSGDTSYFWHFEIDARDFE